MATKRTAVLSVIAGSFVLLAGCDRSRSEQLSPEAQSVATASNMFAVDLFQELRSTPGNMFLSPFSISTALAMTYAGAAGTTAEQMAQAVHFSALGEPLHQAYEDLLHSLSEDTGRSGYRLSIANRIWVQRGDRLEKDFLRVTREHYGAAAEDLAFARSPEKSRTTINSWVARKTERRIVDLLPPGSIDKQTALVLTNAIYFKGEWDGRFDTAKTETLPFKLTTSVTVDTPMMHRKGSFGYARTNELSIIELPYKASSLSMVVLLPDSVDALSVLEERISVEQLDSWLSMLRPTTVDTWLPRFRFTTACELSDDLQALGMKDAFDPARANFSGINGRRDLFVSLVAHSAFIEVNEEGTEAAAATAIHAKRGSAVRLPSFIANHPFIFLIRDSRTGSILFLGRVADPSKSGA